MKIALPFPPLSLLFGLIFLFAFAVPYVIVAFVVSWQKGLILLKTHLSHGKDGFRRKNLRGFPDVFVLK
jgi:hypothetical protein